MIILISTGLYFFPHYPGLWTFFFSKLTWCLQWCTVNYYVAVNIMIIHNNHRVRWWMFQFMGFFSFLYYTTARYKRSSEVFLEIEGLPASPRCPPFLKVNETFEFFSHQTWYFPIVCLFPAYNKRSMPEQNHRFTPIRDCSSSKSK